MRSRRHLEAQLSAAFVDGEPISWSAALQGARTPAERASIEQLRAIDSLRIRVSPHLRDLTPGPGAMGRWVTRLTCAQLAVMAGSAAVLAVESGGFHLVPLPQLLLAVAFAASAAVLAAAEATVARGQALMNLYLIATVAFLRPVFHPLARTAESPWLQALLSLPPAVAPEALLAAELWSFALAFPTVTRLTRFDRIGRAVTSALWALGFALFAANLAAHTPALAGTSWVQALRREHPAHLFWFLLTVPMFGAVGAIAWRTRLAGAEERRRVRRFVLALASGTGPFLLLGVSRLFPPFDRWFTQAPPAERAPIVFLVLACLALAPLATAVTVVTDRALDVRIVVQRVTQHALARRLLALLTAAPLVWVAVLLYQRRQLRLDELLSGPRGRLLLSWAAAAAALLAFRRHLVAFLDRRFGLRSADRRAEFQRALDRARDARGFRELVFTVARELMQALDPERVSVVRLDSGAGTILAGAPISWRRGCGVEAIARNVGEVIDLSSRSSLLPMLPAEERTWLATERIATVVPVRRRDGQVLAVIALGAKRSGMPITADDRWLIGSLATVVALAWPGDLADAARRLPEDEVAFECPRCLRVGPAAPLACACGVTARPAALPFLLNGKFELARCLGWGGMGVVYLARDLELDREVAVKTLPAASAASIAQLRVEARAMAALSHPGLAGIHGIEIWRDTPALIVEYCPGGTLAARLNRGRLAAPAAFEIGRVLLHALRYMHARGIAHRDIKPSNIGFTAEGQPKLLDFGISAVSGAKDTAFAGTAQYLPPESFRGDDSAVNRDLWAIALVLFEAIAAPEADPATAAFFLRALAADPGHRYGSAAEMLAALPACGAELARSDP